jgi:hypothetical protein
MAVIDEDTILVGHDRFFARFDPPRFVYGTVRDKDGNLAAREVRVVAERGISLQLGSAVSSASSGAYEVEVPFHAGTVRVVFDGEADRNALVFSGVIPEAKP